MTLLIRNTSLTDPDDAFTDRIHAHLDTVLASALFAGTRRLKSVLRYLVLQALNGTAAGLNEYRIAVEAFDKPDSFDPGTDPIVRVEISRLRARLVRYYDVSIVDDGISFELPRGTYGLSIRDSFAGSPMRPSGRDPSKITIGVSPLHATAGTPDDETLCVQLARELDEILGNETYLSTVAQPQRFQPRIGGGFGRGTETRPDVDFIVDGSIQTWSPLVYATMRLIDVKRGGMHILGHYVYQIPKTFTLRMDLPSAIVADIRSHLLTSRNGSMPERTPLSPDRTRHLQRDRSATMIDTIIGSAIETFADYGYFGATVDAIALNAHVTNRFVLDLFGNKNTLFIESVRVMASRTLDLPHFEELLTIGGMKRDILERALLAAIRRWYSTLSIERARLSTYSGLTESIEYQHLIHEPIERIMRHLTSGRPIRRVKPTNCWIDIQAAAQSLIVFLIYFRVAPWSPVIKEEHDHVAETIMRQTIACLFDRSAADNLHRELPIVT
jgi:AcrR family transcriptional regulator